MLPQKNNCTGCGNCAAVCPQNCITMVTDSEGFRCPVIDLQKCIKCRKCEKTCSVLNVPSTSNEETAVAAQNNNEQIRQQSSSGGVFFPLAVDVISAGGKVCAAVYDSDFSVRHVIVENLEDLAPMHGAKYSQSRSEHCFGPIKEYLNRNIPVMFVGTPCQCAGLRSFLGKDYGNLLLVDMICHGVPSPTVLRDYLQERRSKDAPDSNISAVNMRSKVSGWSRYAYSVEIVYSNGKHYIAKQGENAFLRGFTSNLFLRPSCSNCSFKGISRCSDLTLGDYWGVWEQHPDFDDNKGTSLLLIHSERGLAAWAKISEQFCWRNIPVQEAIQYNPSVTNSSMPHPAREMFFTGRYKQKSVENWIWKCILPQKELFAKRLIRRVIGK